MYLFTRVAPIERGSRTFRVAIKMLTSTQRAFARLAWLLRDTLT